MYRLAQNTRAQNIDLLIEKKNGPSEAALFLLGDFTQNKKQCKGRSGRLIFFLGEIVGQKIHLGLNQRADARRVHVSHITLPVNVKLKR